MLEMNIQLTFQFLLATYLYCILDMFAHNQHHNDLWDRVPHTLNLCILLHKHSLHFRGHRIHSDNHTLFRIPHPSIPLHKLSYTPVLRRYQLVILLDQYHTYHAILPYRYICQKLDRSHQSFSSCTCMDYCSLSRTCQAYIEIHI